MSALDELLTNHEKPLQDEGWLEYSLVLFWEETDGYEYAAEYASEELAKLRDDNAALRSELDALKVAAKKLLNEMPESEIELIREVWGNTNTRILLERRSELAAALAGNE